MSTVETIGAIASLLGFGGLGAVIGKAIDARRERKAADKDLAERAFDAFEHEREETGKHASGWTECERRCGRLEVENAHLRARVVALEGEVAWMTRTLREMRDGADKAARVTAVTPIAGGRKG